MLEEPTVDLPPQGYRLRVGAAGIDVVAPDRAGLLNATATLRQWLALHHHAPGAPIETLWGLEVEDWPDFLDRGVMLDVSRDQVPTLATLERLVDLLASWKINQLQLYTEHTFAYAGHEEVWRGWSPLHAGRRARARRSMRRARHRAGAEPEQLRSPAPLAGAPSLSPARGVSRGRRARVERRAQGAVQPLPHRSRQPRSCSTISTSSSCPAFAAASSTSAWTRPSISGSAARDRRARRAGRGRVYLDFLRAIHERVAGWGRRMLFWGDIALEHPELLADLPGDALPLLWGYEADHPFAEQASKLAASGLEFYLCPGTSSWLSFGGRWSNALANLAAAATAGAEHGARGLLITDWGDRGHLQPLAVSLPPWLAGACFAWNADSARSPAALPTAELLDLWAAPGLGAGATMLALGDAHLGTGRALKNSTVPFHLLMGAGDPLTRRGLDRLDPAALAATSDHVAELVSGIRSPITDPRGLLVADELGWSGEAIRLGCDLGRARLEHGAIDAAALLPAAVRGALTSRLDDLIARRRELWLKRSRPGGLADALGHLRRARDASMAPRAAAL